jgi:hypothetical protein
MTDEATDAMESVMIASQHIATTEGEVEEEVEKEVEKGRMTQMQRSPRMARKVMQQRPEDVYKWVSDLFEIGGKTRDMMET